MTRENEDVSDGSVTNWLRQLKAGSSTAFNELWNRYYGRLSRFARRFFGNRSRVVCDEEDIASTSLEFLLTDGIRHINNRQELIKVLITISKNNICSEGRYQAASSRGGGRISLVTDLDLPVQEHVKNLQSTMAGPELVVMVTDLYRHLRNLLPTDELRQICDMRIQGATIDDISTKVGLVDRSIQRKLKLIQTTWIEYFERQEEES